MKKIAYVRELTGLTGLPVELINVIREAVTILDAEYGENREVDSGYGGYVLVVEHESELANLKIPSLDLNIDMPEYADIIACSDGQVFISRLFLMGSDYGVVVIMPEKMCNKTI